MVVVISMKEYRKRNASGAVYDDPRVAVGAGRFDAVVARAEAESKCKAIRHGVIYGLPRIARKNSFVTKKYCSHISGLYEESLSSGPDGIRAFLPHQVIGFN